MLLLLRSNAVIQAGAASLAGVGSLVAAGTVSRLGTGILTGTGALTTTGVTTKLGAASLVGSGTLGGPDVPAVITRLGVSTLTGAGALTAAGGVTELGIAALVGVGTLTAAGTITRFGVAALVGAGSLAVVGVASGFGAVSLVGAGVLTPAGTLVKAGDTSLAGASALTTASTVTELGAATMTGATALVSAVLVFSGAGGVLVGAGSLSTVGSVVVMGAAVLTGAGVLAGDAVVARPGAASLTGHGGLGATGVRAALAAAVLAASGHLSVVLTVIGVAALHADTILAVAGLVYSGVAPPPAPVPLRTLPRRPGSVSVLLDTRPPVLRVLQSLLSPGSQIEVSADEALSSGSLVLVDSGGGQTDLAAELVGDTSLTAQIPTAGTAGGLATLWATARDLAGNPGEVLEPVQIGVGDLSSYGRTEPTLVTDTRSQRALGVLAGTTATPPPWSEPMATNTDSYLVGETIYLVVRVSVPGSADPADPDSVTLRGLVPEGGDPIVPGDLTFIRAQAGSYFLAVDTTDLPPGPYEWVAELGSATGTTLVEGSLVLVSPRL